MDALNPDAFSTLAFRDPEKPDKPLNTVFSGRLRTALLIVQSIDPTLRGRAVIKAEGLPDAGVPPPPFEEIARLAGLSD